MNIEYFPYFVRKLFPDFKHEDLEALSQIGTKFKKYLEAKFEDNKETLKKVWDIDPAKVLMREDNPLYLNGYHPGLVLHFMDFVEIMKKEIQNER